MELDDGLLCCFDVFSSSSFCFWVGFVWVQIRLIFLLVWGGFEWNEIRMNLLLLWVFDLSEMRFV